MHAKAIRGAVYDAAILIGGILLIDQVTAPDFWAYEGVFSDGYADWRMAIKGGMTFGLAFLWLGLIVQRYRDWKSLSWIEEKVIDYDPDPAINIKERLRRLD